MQAGKEIIGFDEIFIVLSEYFPFIPLV